MLIHRPECIAISTTPRLLAGFGGFSDAYDNVLVETTIGHYRMSACEPIR